MARRGRFGRRPRASGNMTALVAALYREQRAAEDRQMFDAWENGGMVDGKPVTDQRLRDYIAVRRDSMGKEDPLWDEWNNRLIQLDFRIGEEKIQLAFQQGKVGAGAVANFYRSQLSKIPKDSGFYRDVASRAAQWAKSAAGAARGRARASLGKALEGKQNGVAATWANYANLEGIITEAARRAGLIAGNQTLVDADASRLLDLFAAGIAGPKGTTITFADWQRASVDAYKAFDTQIAINKQLNRGTKELTEQKGKFLDRNLVRINTIDDRSKYEAARDLWLEEINDAQGDPAAIIAAGERYTKTLESIMANAEKDTGLAKSDPEFIGGLKNEISAVRDGKATGATVFDLQSGSDEGVPTGDAQSTAENMAKVYEDAKALDSGAAYYGQAEFGGPLGVVYYPPGAALDPFGRNGLGPDSQPAILSINGKPTEVILKGQAIKSVGLLDPNGGPVTNVPDGKGGFVPAENLSATQIAFLLQNGYTQTEGGVAGYVFQQGERQTFAVVDPATGELRYTGTTNPFAGTLAAGEDGFVVFGGAAYGPNNEPIVGPPKINVSLSSADNLLVDPTVTPANLRAAAKTEEDPEKQANLIALADKKQKDITAEADFLSGRRDVGPQPGSFGSTITGAAIDAVRAALGVVTDLAADPSKVPDLKKAAKPPTVAQAPNVAPPIAGSTGAFVQAAPPPPPPAPKPVTANDLSDEELDYIAGKTPKPPPPPKPSGGGGIPGNKLL